MQNRTLICGLVAIAILASTGAAFAQSETDRLREALRQAIAQTRTLEDERTALQGKLASAECDKANLKAQVEGAQAETKKAQKQYRDAVEEFNSRLAERDATLDKWKSAYEEAADVARAKDAERAKFETEATACEASVKSCRSKNTQLVKIDRELVRRKRRHPFRRQAGRARTADRGWARTSSKPAAGLYRQDPRPKGDRMRKVVNPQALRGEALHLAAPVALVVAVLSISAAALAQTASTPPAATNRVRAPAAAPVVPTEPRRAAAPPVHVAPTPDTGTQLNVAAEKRDVIGRVGNDDLTADEIRAFVSRLDGREQAALAHDPALLSQAVRVMLAIAWCCRKRLPRNGSSSRRSRRNCSRCATTPLPSSTCSRLRRHRLTIQAKPIFRRPMTIIAMPSLRHANSSWRKSSSRHRATAADRVNPSMPAAPLDASSPDLKVCTVNIPAVQQQYGKNFGVSVMPYRPPPPICDVPMGRH
jgi:hypothetical protein